MSEELKPCPFCGALPTRVDIVSCGTFAVYCESCRSTGPRIKVHPMEDRNEIDMARNAWNKQGGCLRCRDETIEECAKALDDRASLLYRSSQEALREENECYDPGNSASLLSCFCPGREVSSLPEGGVMHFNVGVVPGIMPLMPQGTNSTMFTECCQVAICDDEPNCPYCKRKIRGWDAESNHERGKIRWQYATGHWKR